jgi:streptogramin lyase
MTRSRRCTYTILAAALTSGLPAAEGTARTAVQVLRVPGRSLSVAVSPVSVSPISGRVQTGLKVTVRNSGSRAVEVSKTDFALSVEGDTFGARAWNHRPATVRVPPHHSRALPLIFELPRSIVLQAALFYRPAGKSAPATISLNRGVRRRPSGKPAPTSTPTINTFYVSQGVGEPWGTAIDSAGNVWFAEPGCDFAPTCSSATAPGQIGELTASSHSVLFYTLPDIPGNQPIFLAFDSLGNLWFTTPDNGNIGEFSPLLRQFIGQWAVTPGSGPWDLAIAGPWIWYTDHLSAAVSRFNTVTHTHRDFPTPSPDSNPYGIAIRSGSVWFTENNSDVDRVGVLHTRLNNAISEYPIVLPMSGTPHMIAIDGAGHPWWTEGFSSTIATLDPAAATPGQCGTLRGTCGGVRRYALPAATGCAGSSHTSGIAFQRDANLVWLDDALTARIGSFNPATGSFALNTLENCNAHPHDGLALDTSDDIWFDEEFGSAIGELVP